MDKFTKSSQSALVLVMAVGLTGLSGCETNPYTGRSQLLMTSVDQEMQMKAQAYRQVKNDPKMHQSQDPREVEPVRRVAARIIEAAKRSKYAEVANQFQWEVTVIKDDKTMNAFALPGGKVAVYTGIFSVAKTEAWLAAVFRASGNPCVGSPRCRADEPRPTYECDVPSSWNGCRNGGRQCQVRAGCDGGPRSRCSGWCAAALQPEA